MEPKSSTEKWYRNEVRSRTKVVQRSYNDGTKDRTNEDILNENTLNEDHKKTRLFQKRYKNRNRKDRTITTIFIGAMIPFVKVIE